MLKKLCMMLISVICGIVIVMPNGNADIAYSAGESTSSVSESKNDNDNSSSKAVTVIIVLAVFTVTCSGSAVITYRLRRKTYINNDNSENKHSDL